MQLPDVYAPDVAFVFGVALHGRIVSTQDVLMTKRILGYDYVKTANGGLRWRKALGPDGHLYITDPRGMCSTMFGQIRRSSLPSWQKVWLWIYIVGMYWWPLTRTRMRWDTRQRVNDALRDGHFVRAALLALRYAVLSPRELADRFLGGNRGAMDRD
jgi:hypothetical protein